MSVESSRIALEARIATLKMVHRSNSAHIGSSFSVIDILAVLYVEFANLKKNFDMSDAIIVSKGHAAAGTYAVMALTGHFPAELLDSFGMDGSTLGGHVTHSGNPGVVLSTGSLGHGLPYGIGIAYGKKLAGDSGRTFVVISDGECNEGTTWESALMASQFQLKNLTVIIDRNRIQSLSGTEETMALEPLEDKWRAFKWKTLVVDGHSHLDLLNSLQDSDGPICVIAETIKGKGVSFMQNSVLWHYRSPSDEEFLSALAELENSSQ